jgi:hypothetical protein
MKYKIKTLTYFIFSFLVSSSLLLSFSVKTSDAQCPKNQNETLSVHIYTQSDRLCGNDSLCMHAEVLGGSGSYSYVWQFAASCGQLYEQEIVYYAQKSAWIKVDVFDLNTHASAADSIYVMVE